MDGRIPSSSTSSLASHHLQQQQPPRRTNLRSSVSMFIEDSRITAVANADSSPLRGGGVIGGGGGGCDASGGHCSPASSFYSVTSFSSSAAPQPQHTTATSSWNLRPSYCQISTTLPDSIPHQAPQGGGGGSSSYHSSPVRSSRGCSSSPVRFSSRHGSSGSREIIHRIIREQSVENGDEPSVPHPPPPPPPSQPLRRSTLNVEPVISFINVKETLPHRLREDRAYTSVNLTLRSPTTPTAAQSPSSCVPPTQCGGAPTVITQGFDHHSTNTSINTVVDMEAGTASFRHVHHHLPTGNHQPTNLMYSTYSNSSDGFEAQVQIHFGPHGGTFTASRRRNHNISIRQMNSDLLSAQTERKDKLRTAIHDRKCMLAKLQTEIVQLRSQLQMNPFSELEKLKQENQRLRIECDFMAREVDLYQNGSVPLGETNEEFYQGINPGQSVEALFGITNSRGRNPSLRRGSNPPPRPPPPKFLQSPQDTLSGGGVGSPTTGANPSNVAASNHPDGEWRCSMCTFQNHRDLDFCEQCQMVRVKHGPSREQNIRIRVVRHHQQQPPQPRRVVHSWVM